MCRIKDMIEKYAAFGMQDDGSISRVFGSKAYLDASIELKKDMQQLGMKSYIDSVGNVHGIYEAASGSREIMVGSHLDTVPFGGMFDGLYGIVSAVECVRKLKANNMKLPFAIHIVATNGEEGNILGGTFGSRCMTGSINLSNKSDSNYNKMLQSFTVNAETRKNMSWEDVVNAEYDFSNTERYLELHIEQGNLLENKNKSLGIVNGIVGLQRYKVCVHGKRNHSGTTMMEYREDALIKAAHLMIYIDELARSYGNNFVATVQAVEVKPNALAVINDYVEFVLEIRSVDLKQMNQFIEEIEQQCKQLKNIEMQEVIKKAPVDIDPDVIDIIESVCKDMDISYEVMPSGATHDGNMYAKKVPVNMLFVPSHGGVSHSKQEYTEWEQCSLGEDVLYALLLKLASTYESR